MGRPRKFDHDRARELRERTGLSYDKIGAILGVSGNAIAQACDDGFRERQRASSRRVTYSAVCPDCGGPRNRYYARCRRCDAIHRTNVRDGKAYCSRCDTWKPLDDFYRDPRRTTRGVKGLCRACDNRARQKYRETHREQERARERARSRRRRAARADVAA